MSGLNDSNAGGHDRLNKVLNHFDIAALSVGAMIGWGWVVLAGTWVGNAGTLGAIIAFVVGGTIVGLIGMTYAELAAALPFAGGEHAFVGRAFGPTAAYVATWAIVLGYVSVVAFEAIALPVALVFLFPGLQQVPLWEVAGYQVHLTEVLIGALAAIAISLLNVVGVKTASRMQGVIVLVVFLAGLVLILGGFAHGGAGTVPLLTDLEGGAAVLIMVPFLFVGFDVIPQLAEEIDLPHRKIGGMLILSVVIATLFYVGIIFGVGSADIPEGAELASAAAGSALWGSPMVGKFVVLAGVAGILTSWNAFLIGGSRALFALAREHQIPAFLSDVHPRYGTPHKAILSIMVVSVLAPLFGRQALVWIVDAGGLAIVLAYSFVAASFLKLRSSAPDMPRPYRLPAGRLIGSLALICSLGLGLLYLPFSPSGLVWPEEWLIVLVWAILGLVVFALSNRDRR